MKTSVIFLMSVLLMVGCSGKDLKEGTSRTEPLMNTFVQVKVLDPGAGEIIEDAFDKGRDLEKKFNAYDPESEVNALNMARIAVVSDDLYDVLKKSLEVCRETGGEFDITIAPAMKNAGFYKNMPEELFKKVPVDDRGIGWQKVELSAGNKVVLKNEATWIDLSGIAKGYIVDKMADLLKKKGAESFLVNAGGDIYCTSKDGGKPWNVGIRRPASGEIVNIIQIRNEAVATSGDYENVIVDEKTREVMSHIIDPATDRAKRELPSSITVIAPTCTRADAFATGMMAMGKEKSLALADEIDDIQIITVEMAAEEEIGISRGADKYLKGRRF